MVYMRNKAVGGAAAAANTYASSNTNNLVFLGHTSVVRDCANPDWPDQLIVNYQFETIQEVFHSLTYSYSLTLTHSLLLTHSYSLLLS